MVHHISRIPEGLILASFVHPAYTQLALLKGFISNMNKEEDAWHTSLIRLRSGAFLIPIILSGSSSLF